MQGVPGHVIMRISWAPPLHRTVSGDSSRLHRVNGDNWFLSLISLWKSNESRGRYENAMSLAVYRILFVLPGRRSARACPFRVVTVPHRCARKTKLAFYSRLRSLFFFPFRHFGPTEHSSANWQEQSVPSNSGKPSSEETPLAPPHWAPDKLAGCSVFTRRIRIDADRHLISQRDVKRSFVRAGLRLQSDANRPHPATLLLFTHFYPSSATPLTDHYQ